MAPTADVIFTHVATRRREIADLVESLDEEQLGRPSLCAGWSVRTVAAHLADAAAPGSPASVLLALLRSGGRPHRANDAKARRMAARPVPEIVALLRERATNRFTPPVTGPRAPLTDVLVHEGDMRVPLGLAFEPDRDAVRIALDFVTTGRPVGFVARRRLDDLRLVASDLGWAWGAGAEVEGAGIDLLMATCGRAAVLDRLHGPGRAVLDGRLAGR